MGLKEVARSPHLVMSWSEGVVSLDFKHAKLYDEVMIHVTLDYYPGRRAV